MQKLSQKQRKRLVNETVKPQSPSDKVKVSVCPWGPSTPAWGKMHDILKCFSFETVNVFSLDVWLDFSLLKCNES